MAQFKKHCFLIKFFITNVLFFALTWVGSKNIGFLLNSLSKITYFLLWRGLVHELSISYQILYSKCLVFCFGVVCVIASGVYVKIQYDVGNMGGWVAFNMIFNVMAFLV